MHYCTIFDDVIFTFSKEDIEKNIAIFTNLNLTVLTDFLFKMKLPKLFTNYVKHDVFAIYC